MYILKKINGELCPVNSEGEQVGPPVKDANSPILTFEQAAAAKKPAKKAPAKKAPAKAAAKTTAKSE